MADDAPTHACFCGKTFMRKEHLRRHQATHNEPSFVCPICQKAFSRSDLLRRHLTGIHGEASAAQVELKSRRARACDACHENKTKCDGGSPCGFCEKRERECTYERGQGPDAGDEDESPSVRRIAEPVSRLRLMNRVDGQNSVQDHPTTAVAQQGQIGNADVAMAGSDEAVQSRPALNIDEQTSGLRYVIDTVRKEAKLLYREDLPDALKTWLSNHLDSYYGKFHDRWPVVHSPSMVLNDHDALVLASMVMITVWNEDDGSLDKIVLELHKLIVSRLVAQMFTTNALKNKDQPWPVRIWQAMLLNIVFAFETGLPHLLAESRQLLGILVAALKDNNVLDQRAINKHQDTHYPGTFPPWFVSGLERWSRLVATAFRIDTYLGLLRDQPSFLRHSELQVTLTPTFSMWNATGLDVFFARHAREPADRANWKMCDMHKSSQPLLSSGVLIEDIQSGLLSTWHDIWTFNQTRKKILPDGSEDISSLPDIQAQLDGWKFELDGLLRKLNGPVHDPRRKTLIQCYSGIEGKANDDVDDVARVRILSGIVSTNMLYHLLCLHIFARVDLTDLTREEQPPEDTLPTVITPATVSSLKNAVIHALFCVMSYEEVMNLEENRLDPQRRLNIDPIVFMAMSLSAGALMSWIQQCPLPCFCQRNGVCSSGLTKLEMRDEPDILYRGPNTMAWLEGTQPIMLDGLAVCKCSADGWRSRLSAALQKGCRSWNRCNLIVNALHAGEGQT